MQSAKRVKTGHVKSHHTTLVSPSPNSGTGKLPTVTLASGEDDRFNLSYGGIMDDEIQEMAPLPVKPSQVKVCQFTYLCKYY